MTGRRVTISVNGVSHSVPADTSLLTVLRDWLGLTGAKPGCGEGACGACTVLADGEPLRSCQLPAESANGIRVTTIEGLAARDGSGHDRLSPVQRAFVQEGAAQCGYCTPGFVLAATALLARRPDPDDAAIAEALSGHICRCGGYPRIRRAVRLAAVLARADQAGPLPPAGPDPDRWGPPGPGEASFRPKTPWDLSDAADRDWFRALGDGLVVVLEPQAPDSGTWTTARGAWLHIGPDGLVTAFTGKVDVGQDNATALRLLVAEELGVPLGLVRIAMGDTDVCPYDSGTFGSRSMPDAGNALRTAAAYARGLPPARPGDRRVEVVTGAPAMADPATWTRAGQPHRAPGLPEVVTGARRFVSDLTLPGMLHGALLRPPVHEATLRSFSASALDRWPGATLIDADGMTGVVAPDAATAAMAIAALAGTARWDLPDAPGDTEITGYLRAHPPDEPDSGRERGFSRQDGSAAAALEVASVRCQATYTAAYVAHAALETRAALADWDGEGRLTVWTGTQTPFPVRAQVATATGTDERHVRIIVPGTGGAFGGKHPAQVAIEAAVLAKHAGRPVKVAWSRAEEFTAGGLRRAAVIDVAAGATSAGELSGWKFVNINAGAPGITTPYRVADYRIEYQPAHSPLVQGSYRALAATANNFARESMIDELAARLGVDPVRFRLRNLADERLAAVLRSVADRVGWATRSRDIPAGLDGEPAVGWGVACGTEKDGRVATAVQVAVWPDRRLRVTRLVSGYECGTIVNPATVTGQVEGAAVMGLGGALFEAISFADGVITNGSFSRYRVPRIDDVPPIEVILLDRPDLPPAGAGETPIIAVAPALAAAIFDATGRRLRSLPLTL